MKSLKKIAWILLIIGGLNLGLDGISEHNLINSLGSGTARTVNVLVGVSALVALFSCKSGCKKCNNDRKPPERGVDDQ